jgi:FHA domain
VTLSTNTNVHSEEWAINDEVVRLRVWGSDRVFPLLSDTREPYVIGTATTCSICIDDPKRLASREHAHLERIQGRWGMIDHGSKNGLYRDGAKVDKLALSPGVEIGLGGGVVLVAESARWIALRNLASRMLGWRADRAEAIDLALREIRLAAMRRVVLVLCGEHDLVPLAEELHRATLTAARPFVLCNPRRRASDTPEGSPESMNSGVAAVEAAAGGTVCLLHKNLPSDLEDMLAVLRRADCQTQLVMCAERARAGELFAATPVIVPRLASRKAEIDRIIMEYATDAAAAMGVGERWLSPTEHAWIRDHLGDSLPDIQKATLRLAAIRRAGSISAGALRVGLSHTGMLKWLRTHEYPNLESSPSPRERFLIAA